MKQVIVIILFFSVTQLFAQNTGVNTTDPQYTLDVRSLNIDAASQINISNPDKSRYLRFFSGSDSYPDPSMTWRPGKNFLFATYDDVSFAFTEYMRIDSIGDVGIGIFNPEARLDIKGGDWNLDAGNPGDLRIGDTLNNLRIGVSTGGGGAGTSRIFSTDMLIFGIDNDPIMTMTSSGEGKVGVGTNIFNARMSVDGSPNLTEDVFQVNSKYQGNNDVVGIDCNSFPATGYGVGANFRGGYRGVRGLVTGGTSQRLCIGVVGAASGENNQGTRVGVWGDAYGSNINWAGYFDNGNVYIKNDLRIGSGAINGATGYKVAIDGKIIAEEVRVQASGSWPDYVFEEDYDLQSINNLEKEIKKLGHLPGVPSAKEVEEGGVILGEMQKILLEKVEELTLYTIDLQKQVESLKAELHSIKANK